MLVYVVLYVILKKEHLQYSGRLITINKLTVRSSSPPPLSHPLLL